MKLILMHSRTVKQKVSVLAHNIYKTPHDIAGLDVCAHRRCAIVAVRVWVHAEIAFPFADLDGFVAGVFGSVEVSRQTAAVVEKDLFILGRHRVEVLSGKLGC